MTSTTSKLLGLSSLLVVPCSCAYISVTSNGKETTLFKFITSSFHIILPIFTITLYIWSIFEFIFYFYFLYTRRRLQQTTKPARPLNQLERASLFWNCVQTINNVQTWSEGWFYYKKDYSHPQFKDIQRENMALWFAWAFWHEHLDIVRENQAWANEIEWMLTSAEDWFHMKFPAGLNTNLECIRLNLDAVQAIHRPLVVYVGLYVLTTLFNTVYLQWAWGFTYSRSNSPGIVWGGALGIIDYALNYIKTFLLTTTSTTRAFLQYDNITISATEEEKQSFSPKSISYFYREPLTQTKTTPLVFLHGIGAGVICYAEFVHQLVYLDRPIFLVELPYVAMHMVDNVPSASETVSEISDMLHTFGYDKAVYVSHSLGTGASSWIMNMAPETVAGLVMIDPICFLLHYHNVAFNFVHRIPKTLFEYIMHYGAARELYISNYISRHFQWFETIYFSQPANSQHVLPLTLDVHGPLANATIFLSEKDGIVGSSCVYNYLLERGVDARIMEGLEHAMFLSSTSWKKTIVNQVDTIARKADILSIMMNKML